MKKKVYVCCPGNVVTGGPELLHQFVDELMSNGVDAYILYTPLGKEFTVPTSYQHYNISIAKYENINQNESVVVLPEVETKLAKKFVTADVVVWWLSVDNYFGYTGIRPFKKYILHLMNIITGKKLGINMMKSFSHYAQSEYAKKFLQNKCINANLLTDYLSAVHLNDAVGTSLSERENIIAYNPKKGVMFTHKLIESNPDYKFVPIRNMTPEQVRVLLSRAKLYIDFGSHPGKDRFPREAAMAGCCIVTGIKGSASNDVDIPIQRHYKLDENEPNLNAIFRNIVSEIFDNFQSSSVHFDSYRDAIRKEPLAFKKQVKLFIDNLKLVKSDF